MTQRFLIPAALLLLTVQAIATHSLTREEHLPTPAPLDEWPRGIGSLPQSQDGLLDPDAYEMLSPDDVLNRRYFNPASGEGLQLFVAYYKTQLRAKNAHDPKVCLPGSGWNPQLSDVLTRQFDPRTPAATINRYVVAKGNQQNVVLYWYQTHRRALAQEQALRFYRMVDTIRDNRTDMALVRIIIPVADGKVEEATEKGLSAVRELYPHLLRQFPAKS